MEREPYLHISGENEIKAIALSELEAHVRGSNTTALLECECERDAPEIISGRVIEVNFWLCACTHVTNDLCTRLHDGRRAVC